MAFPKPVLTAAKPSPTKVTVSNPAGKSPPSAKKSIDSPLKRPTPSSPLKSKPIAPIKSPAKVEKPSVEPVKSLTKKDKPALKLTIMKPTVGSMMKTPTPTLKTSMTSEAKTPIRNVIKSVTPKTPEPKQSGSKLESGRSSPEKLIGKTNGTSASSLKTSASVKSVSSPVKSVSSPVKSVSSVKSSLSPKSISSVKPISSAVKSLSPVKSVSSPVKSVSSPVKSVSPIKSSSPAKSILSPAKSISSPIKSKPTREIKPSFIELPKDTKTKLATASPIKKPASVIKSPSKTLTPRKFDSPTKLKPTIKTSLITSKTLKIDSISTEIISKSIEETSIVKINDESIPKVEKVDLCHCTDKTKKCDEFSTPVITEYNVHNENFDVAQAFKVAEQLIKIQSNDKNLETITYGMNSIVNWDDVITPCHPFVVTKSNIEDAFVPLEQIDLSAPKESTLESANRVIEMTDLISCNTETPPTEPLDKFITSIQHDENQNIIEPEPSSSSSESAETQSNDEKYFSDDLSSASICSEFIETESNDNFVPKHTDDLIRNDVLPEWTITIDEFSLDLSSNENQSPNIYEITDEKENCIVEKTSCSVSMSYADVLKKIPTVLVNSTNIQHKKESKLNVNLEIKQYQMLKKVEALYSTTVFFNNIENNYQDYDDYYYDEPQYCEMRKKKCKKIKHLSKRHLRNINREPESVENQTDIFVTSVWKNIY